MRGLCEYLTRITWDGKNTRNLTKRALWVVILHKPTMPTILKGEVAMNSDRRFDDRLPLETLLCAYVMDRPQRGLAVDISERGVFLNTLAQDPNPPRTPVGLEFQAARHA